MSELASRLGRERTIGDSRARSTTEAAFQRRRIVNDGRSDRAVQNLQYLLASSSRQAASLDESLTISRRLSC